MAEKKSHRDSELFSGCKVGAFARYKDLIRPLRVGSLDYPERYRNLGAFVFAEAYNA